MTRTCARDLTARINSTFGDLAGMLKRAHDEKAWQALGYADWKSYVAAELKFSEQRSFQLLDFATIRGELADSTVVESKVLPTSERVTRELKAVPKDQRPAVYAEAVEAAGGKAPTAMQVKQAQAKVIEAEIVPTVAKKQREPKIPLSHKVVVSLEGEIKSIERVTTLSPHALTLYVTSEDLLKKQLSNLRSSLAAKVCKAIRAQEGVTL